MLATAILMNEYCRGPRSPIHKEHLLQKRHKTLAPVLYVVMMFMGHPVAPFTNMV